MQICYWVLYDRVLMSTLYTIIIPKSFQNKILVIMFNVVCLKALLQSVVVVAVVVVV